MSHPHLGYRPDIDGLRAVAVTLVIAFHACPQYVPGGFVGVDIFFVISGFLISAILLKDLDTTRFSIAAFYSRRVKRIVPTLLSVMVFGLIAGWYLLFASEYTQLARHIAASAVFVQNLQLWQESGYFDHAADTKPMLHLWSLAVEEQFYVLWPILLMALRRYPRHIFLATWAVGVLSFCTNIQLSGHSPSAAFYLPAGRFWELMMGACAASWAQRHVNSGRYQHQQSLAGALLIVAALVLIDRNKAFPGWWALLPTTGALLLVQAGPNGIVNRLILSRKPLVGIGLISYALYLWHWPLLSFLRIAAGEHPGAIWTTTALATALLLAWICTFKLEQRVRASRARHCVPALLVLLATVFGMALAIHAGKGLPERSMAQKLDTRYTADLFASSRQSDGSCASQLSLPALADEICLTNTRKPQLLIAGDSHAMALYSSIHARQTPAQAMLLSGHGCELYPQLTYAPSYQKDWGNHCTDIARRTLDVIRHMPSLDTIVLVNHYPQLGEALSPYREEGRPLSQSAAFQRGLRPLIDAARVAGKKMVFVVDVPYLKQDPVSCIQRLPWFERTPCQYSLPEHFKLRQAYLEQVKRLSAQQPTLQIADPVNLFCQDDACRVKHEGHALYNDANHISAYAADMILRDMQASGLIRLNGLEPAAPAK